MRKVLLISLAAVIVAGGFAMAAYGQDDRPKREGPPRKGRPGAEGERRGPPRVELTEDQQARLETDPAVKEARAALQEAVAKFQKAVMKIVKDERAARMVMFRAMMQRMRPPGEGEGDRERERRTDRPKKKRPE